MAAGCPDLPLRRYYLYGLYGGLGAGGFGRRHFCVRAVGHGAGFLGFGTGGCQLITNSFLLLMPFLWHAERKLRA